MWCAVWERGRGLVPEQSTAAQAKRASPGGRGCGWRQGWAWQGCAWLAIIINPEFKEKNLPLNDARDTY